MQFPQVPNEIVADHPFAIDMLEAASSVENCQNIDFQFLFLLTDFEYLEGNPRDFLVVYKTDRNQ